MHIRVNAAVEGSNDGLFFYTVGGRLGGIEWVGASHDGYTAAFPHPTFLTIAPA